MNGSEAASGGGTSRYSRSRAGRRCTIGHRLFRSQPRACWQPHTQRSSHRPDTRATFRRRGIVRSTIRRWCPSSTCDTTISFSFRLVRFSAKRSLLTFLTVSRLRESGRFSPLGTSASKVTACPSRSWSNAVPCRRTDGRSTEFPPAAINPNPLSDEAV